MAATAAAFGTVTVSFTGSALLPLLPLKVASQLLLLLVLLPASFPPFCAVVSGSDSLSTTKKRYAMGGKLSAKGP